MCDDKNAGIGTNMRFVMCSKLRLAYPGAGQGSPGGGTEKGGVQNDMKKKTDERAIGISGRKKKATVEQSVSVKVTLLKRATEKLERIFVPSI